MVDRATHLSEPRNFATLRARSSCQTGRTLRVACFWNFTSSFLRNVLLRYVEAKSIEVRRGLLVHAIVVKVIWKNVGQTVSEADQFRPWLRVRAQPLVHSIRLSQVARKNPQAFRGQLSNPIGTPLLDCRRQKSLDLIEYADNLLFDVAAPHIAMASSALIAPGTSSVMSWTCTPTTSVIGSVARFSGP